MNTDDTDLQFERLAESEYPLATEIVTLAIQTGWPGHYSAEVMRAVIAGNSPDAIRGRSTKQVDYLVRRGSRPVGYVAVKRNEIGHLFVRPDASRQGVGAAAVAFALALFRDGGCDTAKVCASLNAEGFYAKQGFHRTDEGSFPVGEGLEVAYVLMERDL